MSRARNAKRIAAAVAQLPDDQRAAFVAVAVEGASYAAVAERLCISAAEVEQRLAAALVSLDTALEARPRRWRRFCRWLCAHRSAR